MKTKWNVDKAHSEMLFKVKHMVISTVSGKFSDFDGYVETDGDDFTTGKGVFEVKTASVDTNIPDRDNHLRSDDFFNAEKFPVMRFESTGIKKNSDTNYTVTGNLTIRDITKAVDFDVEFGGIIKDPWGMSRAGFEATGKINRKEFGLKWSMLTETGGLVAGDEVKITVNVELVKQQ